MWKCPYCNTEVTELNYSVSTTSREYGVVGIYDNASEGSTHHTADTDDFENQDSGDNQWEDDVEYTCRICEHLLSLDMLEWQDPEPEHNDTRNEIELNMAQAVDSLATQMRNTIQTKKKRIEQFPEANLPIIRPSMEIRETEHVTRGRNYRNQVENSMICKKCRNIFIYETNQDFGRSRDEFFECPKCNTTNNPYEYMEKLREGYFNSPKEIKNVKNKRKKTISV